MWRRATQSLVKKGVDRKTDRTENVVDLGHSVKKYWIERWIERFFVDPPFDPFFDPPPFLPVNTVMVTSIPAQYHTVVIGGFTFLVMLQVLS